MKLTFSVIIATYNRCQDLSRVLEGLVRQVTESRFTFEILVADNNSRDQTRAVAGSFHDQARVRGCELRYIFEDRQGKPYALNHAIAEARGDIIAFTDDDVQIDERWLLNLFECFTQNACDAVGGRVLPVYPLETSSWIKENATKLAGGVVIYDCGEETKKYDASMELFIGANYAFHRQIFTEYGLFRTDYVFGRMPLGEDREMVRRLFKKGKVLYYCGKALVRHPVDLQRLRLRHLARWHIALGRSAARMEYEEGPRPSVYYFGIPRYLIGGVIHDLCLLPFKLFNRLAFWNFFRGFFRKVGMITEYNEIRTRGRMQESEGMVSRG